MSRRLVPSLLFLALACAKSDKTGTAAGGAAPPSDSASIAAAPAELRPALASITSDEILKHINVLAADSLEGRSPGTPGEEKTVRYITEQYKAMGLAPGNPDGSYVQTVPMVGYTAHPIANITTGGKAITITSPNDFVAVSRHARPKTTVRNSDIVFVGYGVVAPEYGWDDYKGVSVKGKTLVMLVNDPPVSVGGDTTKLDSTMFKGRAMTYYGRWTYKYEIGSTKGAAAVLIIHETAAAGYPWDVVQNSWGHENFDIRTKGPDTRVPVEGWITRAKADELLSASGLKLDSLKAAARTKEFKPVTLKNAKASFDVTVEAREVQSHNVVAKIEGSNPALKDQWLVFTAHWDHFGRDTTIKGDQIFNGALDNASGVAELLSLANAYSKLATKPERSLLFVALTGEERGLLGAKAYATNPLYPLRNTLADINMDGVNQWGRTKDVTVIGLGNSTLDDVLRGVLSEGGRTVRPDAEPEKGFYYRSDHFEFAKQGVPALYTEAGIEYVGKDPSFGMKKREEYTANDYHKPTDQVKPDWDLSGAVEDARALFRVGHLVANGTEYPQWKRGTEFKAKRDSMMDAPVTKPVPVR